MSKFMRPATVNSFPTPVAKPSRKLIQEFKCHWIFKTCCCISTELVRAGKCI